MKAAPFEYHAPRTVAEAVDMMGSLDNAKALAGGQSLVPMMNFRYVMPDHIVDLNTVDALAGIAEEGDVIRIGATTRQRDVEFSKLIGQRLPLFHAALAHVGHRQTRNRGTVGGSLVHADPSAETPTVLSALDARVKIAGPRGERDIEMDSFNLAFMTTAVDWDEIAVGVEITPWPAGHGYSFQEFARRHGDFAVAGVAVLLSLDAGGRIARAAISVCGIGIGPVRLHQAEQALVQQAPTLEAFRHAASLAGKLDATADFHASTEYRQHLARTLTLRALQEAAGRCHGATAGGIQ